MKKNIEELKKQKVKAEEDFKVELERIEIELTQTKCELATAAYEKDMLDKKYKKYIDKLKDKLNSMGFTFKSKKK